MPSGYKNFCKVCLRVRWVTYRKKNSLRLNALQRVRRTLNVALHRERTARSAMKKKYGMTPEQKVELLSRQGGKCRICEAQLATSFAAKIDHIHGSNPPVVRGILCSTCNTGLGQFKDSVMLLEKAITYLKDSPTRSSSSE